METSRRGLGRRCLTLSLWHPAVSPMSQESAEYALQEILFAARFIATEKGLRLLHNTRIRVVPGESVRDARGPEIVLPADISTPLTPQEPRQIPFNGTF